jgi:hypothetical protein
MKKLVLLGLLALCALPGFAQTLYDDFETTPGATRIVSYRVFGQSGTLIQNQLNPASNPVNPSSTCARYTRNGGVQYDNFDIETPRPMADVTPYITNTKRITMKVYSAQPGTQFLLVLQNKTKNRAGAYPAGKYLGEFTATTTLTNAWETLTFTFNATSPTDNTVTATTIDEITVLIAPGITDPDPKAAATYHLDDIRGPELASGTATVPAVTQLYDNFEDTRKLRFTQVDGAFTPGTTNPSTVGNASPVVGRYNRSANPFDTFEMAPANATFFDDVTGFASASASVKPSLRIYSTAPVGTPVQLVFANAATTTAGNYPTGRHSLYTATTTSSAGWQTLSFTYNTTPDASVKGTAVDRVQLQINAGNAVPGTYYLDDITLPATTMPVARLYENFNDTRVLTYGPMNGTLTQSFPNPSTTGSNPNPLVGKYVRSATGSDALLARFPGTADDITDFVNGTRKMTMKVYSPGPNKLVTIYFIDATATAANGSAQGRDSYYNAFTTGTGWETLTFDFVTILGPGVAKVRNINGLEIRFGANTGAVADTWYFDQIYGPNFTVASGTLYEDFETTRQVTYTASNGATLVQNQANSSVFGENYSATVGRYNRSSAAADMLVVKPTGKMLSDVATYASATATNYFYMKVLSKTIGTPVELRLQNSFKVGANGAGTQSVFTATTTKSNQWELLRFAYQAANPGTTTDATVSTTQVNQLALLFNPGSTTAGQVFDFDFIVGQTLVPEVIPAGVAVTQLYDNFEDTRTLRFTQVDGTFTPGTTNPAAGGGNTSPVVGRYNRSANAFDTFEMAPANVTFFDDVAGFASTATTVHPTLKLYSPAAGTTVQLLFVNAAKLVPNGYPTGRHSLYTATTVAGGWETLSFTYVAGTYDPNVKSTEIDRVQLQIAPNTTATGTYYLDDITLPAATIPVARLYENFKDVRVLTYGASDGVLTQNFANPSTTGANANPLVGKYVRSTVAFDTFYANLPGTADDITDFVNGTRKMTMKVYAPAANRPVTITLLDATATSSNYPTGRNSFYTATTTVANAWQTLTFTYAGTPVGGVNPVHNISGINIQFDGGNAAASTWYFDQLYGPNFTNAPGTVYDNFETVREVSYVADGTLTQNAANSSVFGENYSPTVARYARAATTYAGIKMTPTGGRRLSSVAAFASTTATRFFYLKVFSKTIGTPVKLLLQNAAKAVAAYPNPNGVQSVYTATTTRSNQWETLQFAYEAANPGVTTDATVSATQVNQLLLLFNPGDATAGQTYDFDFLVGQDLITATGLTWTGSVSTDWNDGDNWSGGTAPVATPTAPATIPAGAPRYPILTAGNTYGSPDLIINAGGTLTQTGGTMNLAAGVTNNGTYNQTGGLTVLTGTGSHVFGNGAPILFYDLNVGTGGMNLAGGPNGTVSVRRRMVVAGTVASNGKLILLSDATGTAMVVNRGSGVVNGAATVQRYVTPGTNNIAAYRHFSSPVAGATVADLHGPGGAAPVVNPNYNTAAYPYAVTPFPTVYTYDEQRLTPATATTSGFDFGWQCPQLTDPLAAGRGYSVNLAPTTVSFAGTLRNGSFAVPLTKGTTANSGLQFLGNPYPSPINWDSLALPAGVDNALYVFRSSGTYGGSYTAYVNNIGAPGTNLVAMGQGFFARVNSGTPTFNFTNAARPVNYANPLQYRTSTSSDTRPRLELAVQNSSGENDVLYVYQEAGATTAFDSRFDALKISLNGGQQPTIYQQAGSTSLSIQGLPVGAQPVALPLGVNAPVAGPFAFSAQRLSDFPPTTTLYLEDTQTGTWHDLRAGTYTATLPQGLHTTRFVLHLNQQRTALATAGSHAAPLLQAYPNPAQAGTVVRLTTTETAGLILDLTGRVVGRFANGKVPTAGLAAGIYILREPTTGRQTRLMVQ